MACDSLGFGIPIGQAPSPAAVEVGLSARGQAEAEPAAASSAHHDPRQAQRLPRSKILAASATCAEVRLEPRRRFGASATPILHNLVGAVDSNHLPPPCSVQSDLLVNVSRTTKQAVLSGLRKRARSQTPKTHRGFGSRPSYQ